MPHIIVEYSHPLENEIGIQSLVDDLHADLGRRDTVNIEKVKTRAIPVHSYAVGDKGLDAHMVCIVLKLMPGRETDLKVEMAQGLQKVVEDHLRQGEADAYVTVEVQHLDSDTYQG